MRRPKMYLFGQNGYLWVNDIDSVPSEWKLHSIKTIQNVSMGQRNDICINAIILLVK